MVEDEDHWVNLLSELTGDGHVSTEEAYFYEERVAVNTSHVVTTVSGEDDLFNRISAMEVIDLNLRDSRDLSPAQDLPGDQESPPSENGEVSDSFSRLPVANLVEEERSDADRPEGRGERSVNDSNNNNNRQVVDIPSTDVAAPYMPAIKEAPVVVVPLLDTIGKTGHTCVALTMKIGYLLWKHIQESMISRPINATAEMLSESMAFVVDRGQLLSANFITRPLTVDDPETKHLLWVSANTSWTSLPLRCRLASLSWEQLQLVDETAARTYLWKKQMLQYELEHFGADGRDVAATKIPFPHASKLRRRQLMEQRRVWKETYSGISAQATQELSEDEPDYYFVDKLTVHPYTADEPMSPLPDSLLEADVSRPHVQWYLATRAEEGQDDAQYTLAKFFCPPPFQEQRKCAECLRPFDFTCFRHHCRHCGRSLCGQHSSEKRVILRFDYTHPVRVCTSCAWEIDGEAHLNQLHWRKLRVDAFLAGRLLPYVNPHVDRRLDKAIRVAEGTVYTVRNTFTLTYTTALALDTIMVLKMYGMSGLAGVLMREDFLEAVETLKKVSGMEEVFAVSLHELTACIYYKMALDRGIRGCSPDEEEDEVVRYQSTLNRSERQKHEEQDQIRRDIDDAIRLGPLAMEAVYESVESECQRIAASQGWTTIFVNCDSQPEQPAYALFVTPLSKMTENRQREIVLAIRGTHTIFDVVTDIRAKPVPPPTRQEVEEALSGKFKGGLQAPPRSTMSTEVQVAPSAPTAEAVERAETIKKLSEWEWTASAREYQYACSGMVRAAMWILTQIGPTLLSLRDSGEGYDRLIITGHSLGGGVAAILTAILQDYFPLVRAVAFGVPCCVDAKTSDFLQQRVLSVVLHDDVICRFNPHSVRQLMKELMAFREQVFRHLTQDWSDFVERAGNLWSPKWREAHLVRPIPALPKNPMLTNGGGAVATNVEPENATVIVPEPLVPELWLPGRILHLRSYRGVFRGSFVPRDFPTLRRIELQGNMFGDHRSASIFDGLLEARAVMRARDVPPVWTPFDAVERCQCCDSEFTWHTTFRGEASQYRERYNCRQCGRLVCGPCSMKRRPIPRLGLIVPSRICDVCFHKGDFSEH